MPQRFPVRLTDRLPLAGLVLAGGTAAALFALRAQPIAMGALLAVTLGLAWRSLGQGELTVEADAVRVRGLFGTARYAYAELVDIAKTGDMLLLLRPGAGPVEVFLSSLADGTGAADALLRAFRTSRGETFEGDVESAGRPIDVVRAAIAAPAVPTATPAPPKRSPRSSPTPSVTRIVIPEAPLPAPTVEPARPPVARRAPTPASLPLDPRTGCAARRVPDPNGNLVEVHATAARRAKRVSWRPGQHPAPDAGVSLAVWIARHGPPGDRRDAVQVLAPFDLRLPTRAEVAAMPAEVLGTARALVWTRDDAARPWEVGAGPARPVPLDAPERRRLPWVVVGVRRR